MSKSWEEFERDFEQPKKPTYKELTARIEELQRREAMLVDALKECAEDMEGWAGYASEYFQEKHNLKGDIEKYQAIINATPAQSSAWLEIKHVEWLGKPVGKFLWHDYGGWQQLHKDFEQDEDGVALYAIPSPEKRSE